MDTRNEDYRLIEQGLKSGNREDVRQATIAKERIDAESRATREHRAALVKAHRSGDRGELEKIHKQLEVENRRIKEQVEKYYARRSSF
jgi:hypothetical protein